MDIREAVGRCAYPGRFAAMGTDVEGAPFWAYGLTGRSPASQARTFDERAGSVAIVPVGAAAADPLRHYTAVRFDAGRTIVGNGDHVDEVGGEDGLVEALERFEPEPDPPIHTPRLLAIGAHDGTRWTSLALGAVRRDLHGAVRRDQTSRAGAPDVGAGLLVATYAGDGEQVEPDAVPVEVAIAGPRHELAGALWGALDERFRVLVLVGGLDGVLDYRRRG